jgi:hypothetical protein
VVLNGMYSNIDSTAIFSLLALLYCTTVFAHIFWLLERGDNRNVSQDYGRGVFQVWLLVAMPRCEGGGVVWS